jgi:hypothetical protein
MRTQSRTYDAPRPIVYAALLRAMTNGARIRVKQADEDRGVIQGSSGMTLWSWGERVEAYVATLGPSSTAVTVEVELKAQLFGWGQQDRVAARILGTLDQELHPSADG